MSKRKKRLLIPALLGFLMVSTQAPITIRAEEAGFDWLDEFIRSMEETESEADTKHDADDRDDSITNAELTSEDDEITNETPDTPISDDPKELFINPPMQKKAPVAASQAAARQYLEDITNPCNEIEKKVEDIMASSFSQDFKYWFTQPVERAISDLNTFKDKIESKAEYLNVLLLAKHKKIRQRIVALANKLTALTPRVSLTPPKTQTDTIKGLESAASQTTKKKRQKRERSPSLIRRKKRGRKQ